MPERPSGPIPELLRRGGEAVPVPVATTACFLSGLGLWHQFSRNPPALSCRDAASKRYRLGHIGIPLCDELKSFLGVFRNADGSERYVAVHCRGDCELDLSALSGQIGAIGEIKRLGPEAVERLGMTYGLVTPFAAYQLDAALLAIPMLHVWDDDVLQPGAPPGTVMTNASDYTWAVEFSPAELFERLSNQHGHQLVVGRFSAREQDAPPRPRDRAHGGKVAILTGNAPESGIRLWTLMNERIRTRLGPRCLGDVSMPPVEVHSLPELGLTMELDQREQAVRPVIEAAVDRALKGGAGLLALACHTSHYFTPQIRSICKQYGSEFVSMPEVVGAWAKRLGVPRFGFIGIRFVAGSDVWSAYREPFAGVSVEIPPPDRLEDIATLAYRVKSEGVTAPGITRLRDLIRTSVVADTIVLALTELSLLMDQLRLRGRGGKTLIDPLELYADELASRFIG